MTTIRKMLAKKDSDCTPAIAFLDASDKIIYTNQILSQMLGYSQSEFSKMDFDAMLQLVHPKERKATNELWQKLVNNEIEEFNKQQRLIRKDGTILRVNKTVKMSCDTEGNRIVAAIELKEI
jgi:PAS domain S-box-containing protein